MVTIDFHQVKKDHVDLDEDDDDHDEFEEGSHPNPSLTSQQSKPRWKRMMVTINFHQVKKKDHVNLDEDDDDHDEFEEGSDPSFRHSPLHPFLTFRRAPAITKCQKSRQDFYRTQVRS